MSVLSVTSCIILNTTSKSQRLIGASVGNKVYRDECTKIGLVFYLLNEQYFVVKRKHRPLFDVDPFRQLTVKIFVHPGCSRGFVTSRLYYILPFPL